MKDLGQTLLAAGRVIEIAEPEMGGGGARSGDLVMSK
jgi:hypothetical protein